MTAPTDDNISKVVDLQASYRALDALPQEERVRISMLLASYFLEYAAFEMALERGAEEVAEIIHMAARLDQSAERLRRAQLAKQNAQGLRKI